MSPTILSVFATIGICCFSAVADYSLKRASLLDNPLTSPWFFVGIIMYGSTAFAWVFVMRHLQFATLGVVYAATMIVLLAGIGVVVLHETLRWQEGVGIALAITSIVLLARFA